MGSLFRNKEGLDMGDTGVNTMAMQAQQGATTEGFSTTLFQRYNAMRAMNQAGDAQANAWDLTRPQMTQEQMTDSMRQKNEFKESQTAPARSRTLLILGGIAILGVIVFSNTRYKEANPVSRTTF
jgi:heme/copper-type cytochrome/quinol oxidase subunit 1